MFSGKANWDEIARVVEALDIPVIGNGDVTTRRPRSCDAPSHTGCAAIMVGRGSFGNPWIFRDGHALLRGEPSRRRPPPPSGLPWPSSTPSWPSGFRAIPATP